MLALACARRPALSEAKGLQRVLELRERSREPVLSVAKESSSKVADMPSFTSYSFNAVPRSSIRRALARNAWSISWPRRGERRRPHVVASGASTYGEPIATLR